MFFKKKKDAYSVSSLSVFNKSLTLDGRSSTPKDGLTNSLGERRGSFPALNHADMKEKADSISIDGGTTPSKFASFFSKKGFKSNLKRTKSVTKLDRKKFSNSELENYGALIQARMRTSRSHESLLLSTASVMQSINLVGRDVEIKPLHSSILGQEHCFQVSTSHGSKFYSCRSAHERDKWIQCLRKTIQPHQEQTRRTDYSLKLWVHEGKNLPAKKRYFVEICLDKTLYARTSSKTKSDMLFWGEQFDFNNLPCIKTITINIYKEADKKKKKERNQLISYIHIPTCELMSRQYTEKWYTATSAIVGKAGRDQKMDQPSIRIKARYQAVNILPMDCYSEFTQYLQDDYSELVEGLEPLVSIKNKEEIASSLVAIMQRLGCAKGFLTDIVMAEVRKLDNQHLTFRGNSIATKAMEAYMKLVGEKYLQDVLADFVSMLLESHEDCEVDPTRLSNVALLRRNQENLVKYSEMVWCKIMNSHPHLPIELREVFASLREQCTEEKRIDMSDNLISSCIFLRFLCPAILSPSLFQLTQEYPDEKGARYLTLVAKTIQTLANFSQFGGKEEFMRFMNRFVEERSEGVHSFLKDISSLENVSNRLDYDGYIDLGKELSLLHDLLTECLASLSPEAKKKYSKLNKILENITYFVQNPNSLQRPLSTCSGYYYDNIMNVRNMNDSDQSRDSVHFTLDTETRYSTDSTYVNQGPLLRPPTGKMNMQSHHSLPSRLSTMNDSHNVRVMESPRVISREEVNLSWNRILKQAESTPGGTGDYMDLMDNIEEEAQNTSAEWENISSLSSGHSSNVASSGYQSYGYSQSNSPIEGGIHVAQDIKPITQPLSFSNPVFRLQNAIRKDNRGTRNGSSSSMSSSEGANSTLDRPVFSSHSLEKPNVREPSKKHDSCSSSSSESLSLASSERCPSDGPMMRNRRNREPDSVSAISDTQCNRDGMSFAESPSVVSHLSRSADFSQGNHYSQPIMKRTATDTILLQANGPVLETGQQTHAEGGTFTTTLIHKPATPQSSVRMGVRSVQRKIQEKETSRLEFEQEITLLKQQLAEKESQLEVLQATLASEHQRSQEEVGQWQSRMAENRRQQEEKEEQMRTLIHRLTQIEQQMKKQEEEKQQIIETQDRRIQALDAANARLMSALAQLKDRCIPARNHTKQFTKLTLTENTQFKSSNC